MTSGPYHKPRKRFGQNFLHDEYVIQQIVAAIAPQPGQTLVEIGPGHGAITRLLVETCEDLHLVEIDRDLVARLQATFAQYENLHIHNVDALRFNFCALSSGQPLRLVGNLPYNISTPLLFHVIDNIDCIEDMHFMLQREVVERMAALPGNKDYGRLSIMIQYYCQVEPVLDVGPESFTPPPKVESSVVRLTPHRIQPYHVDDFSSFSKLVAQAFTMRRKTLRNALKNLLSTEQIESCAVDPKQRPDMIDIEAYARLGNCYWKTGKLD
jgi:16S rRNA (adenine1518-N6/adenine1519-N6)-dimethyltransferase